MATNTQKGSSPDFALKMVNKGRKMLEYVTERVEQGAPANLLDIADQYCYEFDTKMMHVGDKKGRHQNLTILTKLKYCLKLAWCGQKRGNKYNHVRISFVGVYWSKRFFRANTKEIFHMVVHTSLLFIFYNTPLAWSVFCLAKTRLRVN